MPSQQTRSTSTDPAPHRISCLVIVLEWNGGTVLIDCLASLAEGTDTDSAVSHTDVLVVDNGSTRSSVAEAQQRFPKFHFLRLDSNKYWAGGNNEGIQWALRRGCYEWIILANNDIVAPAGWDCALQRTSDEVPEAGAIGFKVFGEYTRADLAEFERYSAGYHISDLSWNDDTHVSGCFLAIRTECFTQLGLFDSAFKMYGEEDDMLRRIRMAGWRTVRTNYPIWHVSEYSARKIPLKSSYFALRNIMRTRVKYEPLGMARAFRFAAGTLRRMVDPRIPVDIVDSTQRRMKPTMNPLLNAMILVGALVWNVANWIQTVCAGRRAIDLAQRARAAKLVTPAR
jgi:GT2 family glycosyltransferase